MLADEFVSWSQVQVVGVRKDDFCIEVMLDSLRQHTFDRRLRAHGHKDRGFDYPMRCVQESGTGAGFWTSSLEFEVQTSV